MLAHKPQGCGTSYLLGLKSRIFHELYRVRQVMRLPKKFT